MVLDGHCVHLASAPGELFCLACCPPSATGEGTVHHDRRNGPARACLFLGWYGVVILGAAGTVGGDEGSRLDCRTLEGAAPGSQTPRPWAHPRSASKSLSNEPRKRPETPNRRADRPSHSASDRPPYSIPQGFERVSSGLGWGWGWGGRGGLARQRCRLPLLRRGEGWKWKGGLPGRLSHSLVCSGHSDVAVPAAASPPHRGNHQVDANQAAEELLGECPPAAAVAAD